MTAYMPANDKYLAEIVEVRLVVQTVYVFMRWPVCAPVAVDDGNKLTIKVKSMQRPGSEAIRTQIQPTKPNQEITKITNSQNTKRTNGQPTEQLFPKRWPLSKP